MISIVLYGRNDNYGYNLHKRAALSLNCMAEVLTDSSDEILFVDYNTPDDFPTFPEAIQDTLTQRARKMLRIFRVRPHIHERFKSKTRLLALEPIARNVAIRRSSPSNRWILSTNTDMIFVPLRNRSLSEIARGLTPGFYHAPRIEIPEVLWESLDRSEPVDVIKTVREWGSALHLNEIVLGSKSIRYDGPGDFQLLLRSDLFENHGFDEEMLLGWHVDSNIAARMLLKYREVGDVGERVYGYHCDHTRQVTPAHSHTRLQNDWKRFVTEIERPDVPQQAASWGCASDQIEEIRLTGKPASIYIQALREVIGEPLSAPNVVRYTAEVYNKVDYDPRHLLPFLADMFVSLPRASNLAWYGARAETLGSFASIWEKLNFTGKILLDRPALQPHAAAPISHVLPAQALAKADAFVFDFGGLPLIDRSGWTDSVTGDLRGSFLRVVRAERHRLLQGAAPRRIISLNAINNEYEQLVCGWVAAAATPFATHMRHGFVLPASKGSEAWLPLLSIGDAGMRVGDQIKNDPTKVGWVVHGPYKYLDEGAYLLSLNVELLSEEPERSKVEPCLFIELRAGSEIIMVHLLRYWELKNPEHRFIFVVPESVANGTAGLETRIAVRSPIAIAIRSLTVEPTPSSRAVFTPLQIEDWLPYLQRGPIGRMVELGILAETGAPGCVVFGPYWSLPQGRYEMIAHIERGDRVPIPQHQVGADVAVGSRQLIAANFRLHDLPHDDESAASVLRLPFELNDPAPESRQIETRIYSSGEEPFLIRSLSIRPMERRWQDDLLPILMIGETGLRVGRKIRNVDSRIGLVAYSPAIALDPGAYKLSLQVTAQTDKSSSVREERPCAVLLLKYGSDILAADEITPEAGQSRDYELTFEVPADPAPAAGFEFLFHVVTAANVTLQTLALEPVASAVTPTSLALENWLPFLQTTPRAHADEDGIVLTEGAAEHVIWGPYWTLPASQYEVIASVVPLSSIPEGKPVITIDVSAEGGKRQLAELQWRLGQIQDANAHTTTELRLPFTLASDLPAALRTIETRVHSNGEGSFRICSLTVKAKSDEPERNWLTYLTVAECGLRTGREIKSIAEKCGCIAYTPAIQIAPGHYKVIVEVVAVGADGADSDDGACIGLEIWSGSEPITFGTFRPGTDQPLEFDVTKDLAEKKVELRIRAITPAAVSIRGVWVEKTADTGAANPVPAALRLEDWLAFFRVRSLAVKARYALWQTWVHYLAAGTRIHTGRKFGDLLRSHAYGAAARIFRKLRVRFIKFVKRW
jgi:hypothetical protein